MESITDWAFSWPISVWDQVSMRLKDGEEKRGWKPRGEEVCGGVRW